MTVKVICDTCGAEAMGIPDCGDEAFGGRVHPRVLAFVTRPHGPAGPAERWEVAPNTQATVECHWCRNKRPELEKALADARSEHEKRLVAALKEIRGQWEATQRERAAKAAVKQAVTTDA